MRLTLDFGSKAGPDVYGLYADSGLRTRLRIGFKKARFER
jgi:hypothetical protein